MPIGRQCEKNTEPSQKIAIIEKILAEQGVTNYQIEAVNLPVCMACGCPTSRHLVVTIEPPKDK